MKSQQPEIRFGKFEILDCLKKDTHGSVYLANHIFLSKKIILKLLLTSDLPDPSRLKRFKREAKILARLDHPAIIKVLDFGTVDDEFYISFEYFPGDHLRNFLKRGNIAAEQKYLLARQLLTGVGFAHRNGIVHRDIKPENILVNSDFQLKIADFGLAEVMQEERVTFGSAIVGTPGYMSPEQISGSRLTPQSDLFSIGIVLMEMFTGHNPFLGKDLAETINNISSRSEQITAAEINHIPRDLQPVVRKLLSGKPGDRFASAELVVNAWPSAEMAGAAISEPQSSFKLWQVAVAVAIGLLTIWYLNSGQQPAQISPSAEIPDTVSHSAMLIDPPAIAESRPIDESVRSSLKEDSALPIPKSTPETSSAREVPSELPPANSPIVPGALMVRCLPWANVYVNEKRYDSTPLKNPLELPAGNYQIKLVNPGYPPYQQAIDIKGGVTTEFAVRLDTLFGYLDLQVYPWAEVSINRKKNATTPLQAPLILTPGRHHIMLENPAYPLYQDSLTILRNDTLQLRWNFESATANGKNPGTGLPALSN